MHILLIHQAFADLDEAGGTRHSEMARFLVQRGHQVTIIASPVSYLSGKAKQNKIHWVKKYTPQPGITILKTFTYSALHRSFIHRVFSFFSFMVSSFIVGIGVKNIDLVWGTSPPIFQGFTAWLLARLKRIPFLFEVRDLWPSFAIAVGVLKNPVLVRASLWLEKFLYRHADRVIVNSPGFIQHVTNRGARWVELVPNGADPEMFHPEKDGVIFRNNHHLQDKFVVTYAGAHGLSNDLEVVLKAAQQLMADNRIHFIFIGDGKEKKALQALSHQMNLNNVLFFSPVPKNEMADVLAASDACIAILKPIELYKTTYPNKVFDYMAAGRPVILAIGGVIQQVVEEAQCGVFVQPGDPLAMAAAIQKMADNPVKAREMGSAGRSYIEMHFSRSRLTEHLVLLIEEMRRKSG